MEPQIGLFFMLTNYILIYINGEPLNCLPNLSLEDLLIYLDFNLSSIVVEYNKSIIQATSFNRIIINQGDKVEVLTMVGGG